MGVPQIASHCVLRYTVYSVIISHIIYLKIQTILGLEDELAMVKIKRDLKIPPVSRTTSSPSPHQARIARRSPALSFTDDMELPTFSSPHAAASTQGGYHRSDRYHRARTPPLISQTRVSWSEDVLPDRSAPAPAVPSLGAVRGMIREMAERMAGGGGGAVSTVSKPTPRRSLSGPLPRAASPGRRGTVPPAAFPFVSSSSSSDDDDDDDLRDAGLSKRRMATSPSLTHPSLQRAQEVQRGQNTPTRQRTTTTPTRQPTRPHPSGTATKAVQAQLRALSANYKLLRQRGAV